MISVREGRDRGSVVLEFSGPLDVRSAEQLATAVLQQPRAPHLIIDISGASSIHDAALGRLVDALPRSRSRTIRGANTHQTRLLQYLGEQIDAEAEELAHTD